MNVSKPVVYLAGPIKDCTDEEALSWRKAAKKKLRENEFYVLDPMRRDYRNRKPFAVGVVKDDLGDIEMCDVILANMWKPSVGTSMEVWEASQHMDKDVVVVSDNPSLWAEYCAEETFSLLGAALSYVIYVKTY